jgi:hypothetical protein
MADQGMGFLSGSFFKQEEHVAEINIDKNEENETASTIGQPGYGLVIDGLDYISERKLYADLFEAYGWTELFRECVGLVALLLVVGLYYQKREPLLLAPITLWVSLYLFRR